MPAVPFCFNSRHKDLSLEKGFVTGQKMQYDSYTGREAAMFSTKLEPVARKKRSLYYKITGGILVVVIGLRLLWSLPVIQRFIIPLSAQPKKTPVSTLTITKEVLTPTLGATKEIPIPTLTIPNAINFETVAEVHLLEHWGNGTFRNMAWSPDGRYFAVGTTSGVNLYETKTFQLLRYIDLPLGSIYELVFSPDSGSLAVATGPGDVLVIDLANDSIMQQWEFETSIIELAYLKDGTLIRVMDLGGRGNKRSILKLIDGNWQLVKILDDDFLGSA